MPPYIWKTPTLGDWLEQAAVFRVMIQLDKEPGARAISPTALRDLIFSTWPERLLAPIHPLDLTLFGSADVRCYVYVVRVDGKGGSPPHAHIDERVLRDSYYYLRPVDEVELVDVREETDAEREAREDTYRLEDGKGRRYSMLDAYQSVVRGFRALARPGVTLSKEQLDYIRRIVQHPPSWPSTSKEGEA